MYFLLLLLVHLHAPFELGFELLNTIQRLLPLMLLTLQVFFDAWQLLELWRLHNLITFLLQSQVELNGLLPVHPAIHVEDGASYLIRAAISQQEVLLVLVHQCLHETALR